MSSRRARNDRGAVAVEFALVFPFLALVLFGMITTGLTYSDHLSITNAVREGARFASAVDYTSPTWAGDVQKRVKQVYFNASSSIDESHVCIKLVPKSGSDLISAGSSCGTEPPFDRSTMAAGSCVVKVWTVKEAGIQLVVAPDLNFNIGASSVSYYGRQVGSCTAK